MKSKLYTFSYFLLFFLLGCDRKTFADTIKLTVENNITPLVFQSFNEGVGESGTSILYIGKEKDTIPVKYYQTLIDLPPPPNSKFTPEELSIIHKRQEEFSNIFHDKIYFVKNQSDAVNFDSLSSENIELVVKYNDTIPKYTYNFETDKVKKYKAFPVLMKNISRGILKLPINKSLGLLVENDNKKWQLISNDNSFLCGDPYLNRWYIELRPGEILIYAINFLEGADRGNFKVLLPFNLKSKSFPMSYNKNILGKQRRTYEFED